jgi:hypothetical protein
MFEDDPVAMFRRAVVDAGCAHLAVLDAIPGVEASERWVEDGARNVAHWVAMQAGISEWKANRWVTAAYALQALSDLRRALRDGVLSIDKVVELARFATPETERGLIAWAVRVGCGAIRRRADVEVRLLRRQVLEAERERFLRCWFHEDGTRFAIEGEMPAADGAVIAKTLERLVARIPAMPGEEGEAGAEARAADALVAMAGAAIADDPDPDRATIVIHVSERGAFELEDGLPIHRTTVERLACSSRFETLIEGDRGDVVRRSAASRLAPAWMLRQVRHRDRECRFPGCGARRFTDAHHVRFWRDGGPTTLENLVLICSFHHRLLHEGGWSLEGSDGEVVWHRPDGTRLAPRAREPAAS